MKNNIYNVELKNFSEVQRINYELCNKYPILVPRNVYTGNTVTGYDYSYTMLDFIPYGWKVAFGEAWARDIQEAINISLQDKKDDIFILQLKEKYGILTQYFSEYTDELDSVIDKYEELSKKTCIKCGKLRENVIANKNLLYCNDCLNINREFLRKDTTIS